MPRLPTPCRLALYRKPSPTAARRAYGPYDAPTQMRHALATLTPFVCALTVLLVLSVAYLLRALAVVADPTRARFEGVARKPACKGRRRNEICVPIRADGDGCRRRSPRRGDERPRRPCVSGRTVGQLNACRCGRLVRSRLVRSRPPLPTAFVDAPDSRENKAAERPEHNLRDRRSWRR